jgi:hypothetical protein
MDFLMAILTALAAQLLNADRSAIRACPTVKHIAIMFVDILASRMGAGNREYILGCTVI